MVRTGNVYTPKYVISHSFLLHKEVHVIIGEEYTISCPSFMVGGFGYQVNNTSVLFLFLIQKHVVHNKFDIYVFITVNITYIDVFNSTFWSFPSLMLFALYIEVVNENVWKSVTHEETDTISLFWNTCQSSHYTCLVIIFNLRCTRSW